MGKHFSTGHNATSSHWSCSEQSRLRTGVLIMSGIIGGLVGSSGATASGGGGGGGVGVGGGVRLGDGIGVRVGVGNGEGAGVGARSASGSDVGGGVGKAVCTADRTVASTSGVGESWAPLQAISTSGSSITAQRNCKRPPCCYTASSHALRSLPPTVILSACR